MAEKEATVYIIDLGQSMGTKNQGRKVSDLDWAMQYVWEKITSIVALDRKTTPQGILGLRTDETSHDLAEEEGYSNIAVLQPLGQISLPDLKDLQAVISPSNTDEGDAISAIVVAIQMIASFCKHLKYKKRIIFVTDANGPLDGDDVQQVAEKLKNDGVELVVVGVDFDDSEYGFKQEEKPAEKAENEETLRKLVTESDGIFGTMLEAIEELGVPRIKSVRPMPSYKGPLTLGHPESDGAMSIEVERYPRVMERRPQTASSFVQRASHLDGSSNGQSSESILPDVLNQEDENSNPLSGVHQTRRYHVDDDKKSSEKHEVPFEELAKGYEYGRTAVHISESDTNVTKLETFAGLEIIGFIPQATFSRYLCMSTSHILIARRTDNKNILALSSLIHALYETESYAVARLVLKTDKEPEIRLLGPAIDADYEALLDVQLPFIEDVRPYKFPPLDRVITVSGKKIAEHRNLPSDDLQDAMNDYVDRMDLSQLVKDDDGENSEYMPISDTYSPAVHRIDQAIRFRAVHSVKDIPPPFEVLTRYMTPPEEVVEKAKRRLDVLTEAADVKKVPPKTQARKRKRDDIKPLSGLDVGALLSFRPKKPTVTKENAIPDFRRALTDPDSLDVIKDVTKQLGAIIEAEIKDSPADRDYDKALEKIGAMRDEMVDLEEPEAYNDFMKHLKKKLLAGELNGDRRDMWHLVRRHRLGLIVKGVSKSSSVNEEEGRQFLLPR